MDKTLARNAVGRDRFPLFFRECDSHSRRYSGLFEFLHFEIFCQVTPPERLAHRRCRSGASAPKDIRHIVFTVRSTLSVPFSIAVVSPHLPLRRHAGSGFTPRTHRDGTFRASCLLYRWPSDTSVSNMVIAANLPHMELQQQTEVWQPIGWPLRYPLARAYVSPPPRSTIGSEQRSLTERQVGTQHISRHLRFIRVALKPILSPSKRKLCSFIHSFISSIYIAP